MSMTAKQLAALEAQLGEEQVQSKRYAYYARLTSDPRLKSRFEHMAACHQSHYNRLLEQLN